MPGIIDSVPALDLKPQLAQLKGEISAAIERVVDSTAYILGPEVESFEREFAAYCGCAHAVGLSSGTDALLAALMALEIGPGDEVITSPYTFFATVGSIWRLGAKPVFCDIERRTLNLDPRGLEALISPKTRAIVPVHLFGQAAEMDAIMELAAKHGLEVIEDAAQAVGAAYHGRPVGSIGKAGCFSFFPSKNLGGIGDGGMITTNDAAFAERIRVLRGHGSRVRYYHECVGGNFRLDALQAAVLRVKLKHLSAWTEARRKNAAYYREAIQKAGLCAAQAPSGSVGITLPSEAGGCLHVYNQFVIRSSKRQKIIEALQARRVGHAIYYPLPLHLQECFKTLGYQSGSMPESEEAAAQSLALPMYPELSPAQMDYVVDALKAAF